MKNILKRQFQNFWFSLKVKQTFSDSNVLKSDFSNCDNTLDILWTHNIFTDYGSPFHAISESVKLLGSRVFSEQMSSLKKVIFHDIFNFQLVFRVGFFWSTIQVYLNIYFVLAVHFCSTKYVSPTYQCRKKDFFTELFKLILGNLNDKFKNGRFSQSHTNARTAHK